MPRNRRSEAARPLRVLILSQFFDPEPTLKGLAFAKALEANGCEVEVLTGFPNYPGGKLYPGHRLRLYTRETMEVITVHRVYLYPSHDGSARRRALNYGSFALSAAANLWRVRRPDVVYVHHPPATIGLPAAWIRALRGAPFVYEVQDLWPDTLAATGMIRPGRLTAAIERAMRKTYRRAAKIVVISDGFRRRLVERGVPAEKIEVLPNWAEEGRLKLQPRDPALARELGVEADFVVMFAGTMGKAQALDPVLEAARLLAQEAPEVRFVFVGGGVEAERLAAEAPSNARFLPRQPMERMGAILPLADALLVHLKDDPLFAITIPSKTQAYLYAGVPILMAVRGDAADLVERAEAGVLAEPENPRSIADAVLAVAALSPDERAAMGRRGREFYERELSLAVGARRYADLLREAAYPEAR